MRKRETWELESDEEMKGSTASATASTPSYKRAKSQHIGEVGKVSRLECDLNYFGRISLFLLRHLLMPV